MSEEKFGGGMFGLSSYHAYLVADGSGSMSDPEHSGKQKALAVAQMIQQLIDLLHDDPEIANIFLTVICYDSQNWQDVRLDTYDVKSETYYKNSDLSLWNPLKGHGWETPIGKALAYVLELAEAWIKQGMGSEQRRGVIYLLSDGMNNNGLDGTETKERIEVLNAANSQGRVRLATIGYFQDPENDPHEKEGNELLRSLVTNDRANFTTDDATKITAYIKSTITNLG